MADNKGKWRNIIDIVGDVGSAVGMVPGIIAFFRTMQPAVEVVLPYVAPGVAANIKRNQQRSSDGPQDDVNFLWTVLMLDGTDQWRQLARNIDSFVVWLSTNHPELAIIFVYVAGLEMTDQQRFALLHHLASMRNANNDTITDDVHQMRLDYLLKYEAFRKPVSSISKLFAAYPRIEAELRNLPTRARDIATFVANHARTVSQLTGQAATNYLIGLERLDQEIFGDTSEIGQRTSEYRQRAQRRRWW